MVELKALAVEYRHGSGRGAERVLAVSDANAVFQSGGISAIVGPSGSGKTTLVKVLAGLLERTEGTLTAFYGNPRQIFVTAGLKF